MRMRWRAFWWVIAGSVSAALVACGGAPPPVFDGPAISLSPTHTTMAPASSRAFSATVTGMATTPELVWEASDGAVVGSGTSITLHAPDYETDLVVSVHLASAPGVRASADVEVRRALDSATGSVAALRIEPSAVLLVEPGERRSIEVRGYDEAGVLLDFDAAALEWLVDDTQAVQVEIDAEDRRRATVTASNAIGSAIVAVRLPDGDGIRSPPAIVSAARVGADVGLVYDAQVVFPFLDAPPHDLDSDYQPPSVEVRDGVVYVAGFSDDELTGAYEVLGPSAFRYPVILRDHPVQVGDRLVAAEGGGFFGTVTSAIDRDGFSLVQIEQGELEAFFDELVVRFEDTVPVLASSSIDPRADASVAERSGAIGATSLLEACKGTLSLVDIDAGVSGDVRLIREVDVDVAERRYRLRVGTRLTTTVGVSAEIGAGGSVTVECDLGSVRHLEVPVPGPLASLMSVSASVTPVLYLGFEGSTGLSVSASADVGIEALAVFGFDCLAGHCTNLSEYAVTPAASASVDVGTYGDDARWEYSLGYKEQAEIGVQLGGFVFAAASRFARYVPGLGRIVDNARSQLNITGLEGSVGGEFIAAWDSPMRVLDRGESASRAGFQGVAELALNTGGVNALRERFNLEPFDVTLADVTFVGSSLHRVFERDSVVVTSPRFDGPVDGSTLVMLDVGDRVQIVADGRYPDVAHVLYDSPLHRGEVHADALGHLEDVTVTVHDHRLVVTIDVTEAFCALLGEDAVRLRLLGFNRMLGTVETAGFLGDVGVACAPPQRYGARFHIRRSAHETSSVYMEYTDGEGNVGNTRTESRHDTVEHEAILEFVLTPVGLGWRVEIVDSTVDVSVYGSYERTTSWLTGYGECVEPDVGWASWSSGALVSEPRFNHLSMSRSDGDAWLRVTVLFPRVEVTRTGQEVCRGSFEERLTRGSHSTRASALLFRGNVPVPGSGQVIIDSWNDTWVTPPDGSTSICVACVTTHRGDESLEWEVWPLTEPP